MATLEGIIAPKGMILQVLGNLYGLPSSGRNFSKAVDLIVAKCGYKSKIDMSPYFYLTQQRHVHLKYLHPFWTDRKSVV